ncbi:putative hydrolase [Gordonia hirsuta DSM 44140 = NBRC 16056]|uniref:Nuclease SbcCD subunit D n=1 Tax=Gordonia hirsuta DSM 44140 = NBRC 16056 TaxID=1121927 RepID=L7L9R6_9ACTN|nr:metallophosphoesterase [Gordonia hirsuta]GAC56783.1 putative hydrolase [Gordonia hirsuta DSM 44140 = NBRC 16056]
MTTALSDAPEPAWRPASTGDSEAGGPVPAGDREVTFLHTADWQLGMTRHFLSADAQHTYDQAREDAVAEIGRLAGATGAEFVVVCGDVFDDPRVSSRIVRRTLDALSGYPVPVYLLPGNHDPHDATSIYRSQTFLEACPENVHVLDHPGTVRVREGITLVAAPWTSKKPDSDLIADQLSRLSSGQDLRILVGHGGVDTFSPGNDPAIVDAANLESAVAAGLVDYIALGDRHSTTALGESERIWYAGAPEVTDFDHVEAGSGEVLQVTLRRGTASAVQVVPHRVGRWTFTTLRCDLNGPADIEALRGRLAALPDKSRTVVKLAAVGALGLEDKAAFDDLLSDFSERLAALRLWDRHHELSVIADPSDVAGLGLQGYAAEAAEELVERAAGDDPVEAEAAHAALSLLFRLAGGAR